MEGLTERVARVRARIGPDVTLVAVTKGFGPNVAQAALDAGVSDLGENYAQELLPKAAAVPQARWHFLGHVQRNKVQALTGAVHMWHTVDRIELGYELARRAEWAKVLLQVDVTGAPGRNGCAEADAPGLAGRLRTIGLDLRGLMCVASREDPRRDFRRLAALARMLDVPDLSMGMSNDFEIAVEEGATIVRLGTALFGPRPEATRLRR